MTAWPRRRPPPLVLVKLPDGRQLRVSNDLAETLFHLRGGRVAPGTMAKMLSLR